MSISKLWAVSTPSAKMKTMHRNEDWQHDAKKLAEELLELSTELVKQSNKPHKDYHDKIQDELADVAYRMDKMMVYYDRMAIATRITDKWGNEEFEDE